jgi:hypothetical protein
MISRIELDIDRAILRNLKQLADAQKSDPGLRIAREKANNKPTDHKYRIEGDVLFKRQKRGTLGGDVARTL